MEASIVGGVLAVLMAAWPAAAEEQGDATAGHKLASQFCTACHIVGAERVGSDAAPPFRVIGENPARRLSELHSWRGPMHPVLSNLAFTPGQIADINAYLDSLRGPSKPAGGPPAPEGPTPVTPAKQSPPPIENAPPEKLGEPIPTKPD